jgi:poly-beta-1,6-N-acetyl-D-glucosamine synthase
VSVILFFILAVLAMAYAGFFLWNACTWQQMPDDSTLPAASNTTLSVVIPFRNEAAHLPELLQSIKNLHTAPHRVSFILSDDHSTDASAETVHRFIALHPELNIELVRPDAHGKKAALQMAIEHANTEWILSTDADCSFGPELILRMLAKQRASGAEMVSGPVRYASAPHWQNHFQQTEFAGLIATGAATLFNGIPTMCNGANLLFSKKAWLDLGGYASNYNITGGDDEFLMQQLHRNNPMAVVFCKDPSAMVSTASSPAFSDFIRQRIRWTSKEKHHPLHVQLIRWGTALFYLAIMLGLLSIPFKPGYILPLLAPVLLIKAIAEWYFFKQVLPFFQLQARFSQILRWQGLQLGYPLLVGLGMWRKRFTWKEREHYF